MLSVLLVSVAVGQVGIPPQATAAVAADEAFVEGQTSSIPPGDTFSASFTLSTQLLPYYTGGMMTPSTTGQVAVGTNGMGFQVSLDSTTIDIAILQLEPDELKLLKDAVDTIDLTAKLTSQGANVPPMLEFGIDVEGTDPATGESMSKQICFKDTMDKVEMLVEQAAMAAAPPPPMGPMGPMAPAAPMPPMPPMAPVAPVAPVVPAVPMAPMVPPAPCVDDATWKDSSGNGCSYYALNDPGCVQNYAPDYDYGQFAHCKATCEMCGGPVKVCPPHPTITSDGTTEKIHFCIPAQEAEVSGLNYAGTDLKKHVVSDADFSMTMSDETSGGITFSLTGPDSPEFELKGTLDVSGLIAPSPTSLAAISSPTYCTAMLDVATLAAAAAGPATELAQGRFCDFTSPVEEPCCEEITFQAQDACLSAKATGGHLCDKTSPTMEPCCAETTHEAQDACLASKGVYTRKLGSAGVDEVTRTIALHTLKKLHTASGTASTLFKDYKDEKARLARKTLTEFSVVAIVALLMAAGAYRYCNVRKSYIAASTDEEMLAGAHVATVTE